MKKLIYPAALILLFIILTTTILPADAVYGSNTDWFSQHAALAETVRHVQAQVYVQVSE